MHRIFLGLRASGVGHPVNVTALNPAAGHHHAEYLRPVIASGRSVDFRCAAKFTGHQNQRVIQHPALIEIADKCRKGLVERRHLARVCGSNVAVMIPAAISGAHHPYARFHQAPCQQEASPSGVAPILVAQLGRFLVKVKRIARFRRGNHRIGALIKTVHARQRIALFERTEMAVHNRAHIAAFAKALGIDAAGQRKIPHAEIGVARIRAQTERAVSAAEITRAATAALARDSHVRRQIFARAKLVAHDRADARENHRRTRAHTGHHIMRAARVRCLTVGHRAYNRQLVGHLGGVFEVLRKPLAGVRLHRAQRAAVFRRRKILGIPRLLMRRTARQKNIDNVLRLARFAGLGHILPILARGLGFERQEVAQRKPQPEAAHGAYGQKVTSIGVGGVVVAATELVAGFFAHNLGLVSLRYYDTLCVCFRPRIL